MDLLTCWKNILPPSIPVVESPTRQADYIEDCITDMDEKVGNLSLFTFILRCPFPYTLRTHGKVGAEFGHWQCCCLMTARAIFSSS